MRYSSYNFISLYLGLHELVPEVLNKGCIMSNIIEILTAENVHSSA